MNMSREVGNNVRPPHLLLLMLDQSEYVNFHLALFFFPSGHAAWMMQQV